MDGRSEGGGGGEDWGREHLPQGGAGNQTEEQKVTSVRQKLSKDLRSYLNDVEKST